MSLYVPTSTSEPVPFHSRLNVWNKFGDSYLQDKFDNFVANTPLELKSSLLFYAFAVASSFQYCNLAPDAIAGNFGPGIGVAFFCWVLGITVLTISLVADLLTRTDKINREHGLKVRNIFASVFILNQAMVHGCLVLGRTLSPRVCDPAGYTNKSRGVNSIMEEQMTCNTTIDGRIPPELTLFTGVFMMAHQALFPYVSWTVIAMHWLLGTSLLMTGHFRVANEGSMGEDIAILVSLCALFGLMYMVERRKKEVFLLKMQINRELPISDSSLNDDVVADRPKISTPRRADSNLLMPNMQSNDLESLSSVTMENFKQVKDTYDDYDQITVSTQGSGVHPKQFIPFHRS